MRKITLISVSFLFIFQVSLLSYSSNPKDFINELVNDAMTKLSDNNLTKEEKVSYVENIALENVDIKALGLYTLGELRKSSDEISISEYQKSLKNIF